MIPLVYPMESNGFCHLSFWGLNNFLGSCRGCHENKIKSLFSPSLNALHWLANAFSTTLFLECPPRPPPISFSSCIRPTHSHGCGSGQHISLFLCSLLPGSSFAPCRWEQSLLIQQVAPYPY